MSDILSRIKSHAASRPPKVIDIPEWGLKDVHLKPLTLSQRARLSRETSESRRLAKLLILALHDSKGAPLLQDDVVTLGVLEGEADAEVVTRLAERALGMTPGIEEAKNG